MQTPKDQNVAVLGASIKPERYSNRAILMLKENGYPVIPVHPRLEEIEGFSVIPKLSNIKESVHTLTLYVGPQRSEPMIEDILALNPKRVIMNPGTESDLLENELNKNNIECLRACTLVMLQTKQF